MTKKGRHRELPPRLTPTLVTPLSSGNAPAWWLQLLFTPLGKLTALPKSHSWKGPLCNGVTREEAAGRTAPRDTRREKNCGQIYKEEWRNEVGQVKKVAG